MERKVEIFDEEQSIVIDTDFDTTDFTFYPEEKKFNFKQSIKNDCFYNNETIEYKISINPIEIYMRTLESSHEPPLKYSIKDGVVLESEITKGNNTYLSGERILSLKNKVEWRKIEILESYEVNLYLLSQHPEIINEGEYRRFLRQSVERIKVGVFKAEEAVKNNKNGLIINTGEYGKQIWFPDNEAEKKEMDIYIFLPEKDQDKSEVGKKYKYALDFINSLFTKDSLKYVGISNGEFASSGKLVEYLEKLLDKEDIFVAKKEEGKTPNNSLNNMKWIIVAVLSIIALSGGIWTAIGVFILGTIVINIIKK